VGLFLSLDDALLGRACATALPTETSDEQIINCLQEIRDKIEIVRLPLIKSKALILDGGLAAGEESVVHDASDIATRA
jgi:hypothetical protein